jgi:hypothetical protein
MTTVDKRVYGAESLVYYYLKGFTFERIQDSLGDMYGVGLRNMYESMRENCDEYKNILFPNSVLDPENNSQTSWFDLQSRNNFAINIKYGYESSANSRIRDLTSYAVKGINELLLKENILSENEILSYEEVRNQRFNRISKQIKSYQTPIYDRLDILYLKYTYLFCMNFIEGENTTDNIFFIKFMSSGECTLFQTKYLEKSFLYKPFIDNLKITFSTNTKNDPHKQTVKYYIEDKYIGFLELRSNKRVMLHLRYNLEHWKNLLSILDSYYVTV